MVTGVAMIAAFSFADLSILCYKVKFYPSSECTWTDSKRDHAAKLHMLATLFEPSNTTDMPVFDQYSNLVIVSKSSVLLRAYTCANSGSVA